MVKEKRKYNGVPWLFAVMLIPILLAGCMTTSPQPSRGSEVDRIDRPDMVVNGVEIFRNREPARAYRVMATLESDTYAAGVIGFLAGENAALEPLVTKARELGGDAILIYGESGRRFWPSREGQRRQAEIIRYE